MPHLNLRTCFILRFNLYSTITNLLCTGTDADVLAGLVSVLALNTDEDGTESSTVLIILGLMGISCAFSVVSSSSGWGISPPSDSRAAMAIFVSSALELTMTVRMHWPVEVLALLLDGVGVRLIVAIPVVPFVVPRGDFCLRFLWAAITVLDGFLNKLGLRRLRGGDGMPDPSSNLE